MSLTHPSARGAHDDLVEQLDQHVRELVRREAVDLHRFGQRLSERERDPIAHATPAMICRRWK